MSPAPGKHGIIDLAGIIGAYEITKFAGPGPATSAHGDTSMVGGCGLPVMPEYDRI